MTALATSILIVLFVWLVIGTTVYLLLVARLFSRLREHCPAVYDSLGSPSLIFNNTPKNNMLFLRWLWGRDYDDLSDADTVRKARVIRLVLASLLGTFAALIVAFVVFGVVLNA
jgi:hypothetical protein